MTTTQLADVAMLLRPDDDVAVAMRELDRGTVLLHAESTITTQRTIPGAHKLAVRPVPAGGPVRKYGQVDRSRDP